ncbi:MAG: Ig-like domain-containing protein [Candidatus Syntrophoarchaeum sp.]|nr:Ig-like domain-containing protein [Candidatus Syntrophoarchaeum sp.]
MNERSKIMTLVLVLAVVFSVSVPFTSASTLEVRVRDASTGSLIPNSTVFFANGTTQYDSYNLNQGEYEFNNSSASGVVLYSNANSSLYHFLYVMGGDNQSTAGRDYASHSTNIGIQFINYSICRYDVNDVQNFNITYLNSTYNIVDVPLRPAANLSIQMESPLSSENDIRATKYEYDISTGFGEYTTFTSYTRNASIPEPNASWNITDTLPDPSLPDYANLTKVYGGDNNESLLLMLQLNGSIPISTDYEYQILINTSLGDTPDFTASYNGTTGESHLSAGGSPLETGIASISGSNISFVMDRQYFAGNESTFNVSARVDNGTLNDTASWSQYYFTTAYSPQRSYDLSIMTDTEDIVFKNSTNFVNYTRLSELTQGGVTSISPTLEKGYNVTFNFSGNTQSLTIEVRNNATNNHAPFNDSIVTLITGYNQPYGFYDDVYLPNGTYDFVFKMWGNVSAFTRNITINGSDVTVDLPQMPAVENSYMFMDDRVSEGNNITANFNIPDGFAVDEYRYHVYTYSADKLAKPTLMMSGTTSSGISIPSTGLNPGEYMLIVDAINRTHSQFIRGGQTFVLTNSRLEIRMNDMTAEPGSTVNVRVTATDLSGNVIPNMTVDLYATYPGDNQWWKVLKASNTTGSDGKTTITFTAPDHSGNYFLTFTGNANNTHYARDHRPLMVQDFKFTAYTDQEKYRLNDLVRVYLQTTEFDGTPISGANITVAVHWNPMGNWEDVNTSISPVTTDSNGKATLNYTINNTGPCIFSLTATNGSSTSYAEAFAFVPEFEIEVDTDHNEYYEGNTVNITVSVTNQSGNTVSGLNFYHNASVSFSDPFDAGITAAMNGKNGTVVVMNPDEGTMSTINISGSTTYTGSYNTTGLDPGFYELIVILVNTTMGEPSAFEFTEFEVLGNLEMKFLSERDIFEPYKLNDSVNLSVYVTNLNGTAVSNGTLNFSVGMPWELFMPEDERDALGISGPRITRTGLSILNGTGWINFTLDSDNFTGNTSIPMRDMRMVGTPPFIIEAEASGNGESCIEEIPIFITDLSVSITTDAFEYQTSDTVQFTINVTNSTGPCDVTLQTDMGTPGKLIVFGPGDEYELNVTHESTGNYTATYDTSNGISGEYFALVIASDGSTVAGGGVPFFVKSFDVTITSANETTAGSTINTTIGAGGATTPAKVEVLLLSPSHRILDYNETTATSMPVSVTLDLPQTAQPGIYSIKAIVTAADGSMGAKERSIDVTNSNIDAEIIVQNATANTTTFSLNETVNITVIYEGINTTTLKIFNETGEIVESDTVTQSNTTIQYTPGATGTYYIRLDTSSTIAIASKAFMVRS